MSFVGPVAYGLELLMLWTDKSLHVTFGIATVLGVVLGSAAYAVATRSFRWEGFASLTDLRNHLVGALLMGFGGVTALGCTIGQGLSGVSTLAIGSFIATRRHHRRIGGDVEIRALARRAKSREPPRPTSTRLKRPCVWLAARTRTRMLGLRVVGGAGFEPATSTV